MSLKIKVFHSLEGLSKWTELPETSEYLTDKQLIPNTGDALVLKEKDAKILGISSTSTENIMTVRKRWFNYNLCDIAIVVHYVPW